MSISRATLLSYCDELLETHLYQDYAPNGLQVEGRSEVCRIMTGVTASEALIDAAIEAGADTLIVHHGYFWRNEDPRIVGMKQRRLRKLLTYEINLISYHLPLDGHAELGNNAQLCQRLGVMEIQRFGPQGIAMYGRLLEPVSAAAFAARVGRVLDREPLLVGNAEKIIQNVGICSGGAQGYIDQAAELGLDLYLSGEISEQTTHSAVENDLVFLAGGHHATERFGIKALGEHLAKQFAVEVIFRDIFNPA